MTQVRFVKWFSGMLLVGMAFGALALSSEALNFRFNAFALISGFSTLVNLILIGVVTRPGFRNRATIWFSIYISLLTVWCFTEAFQRLGADIPTAIFWGNWAAIGWTLMPVAFLVFTKVYADSESELEQSSFWIALVALPLLFLVLNNTSELITIKDPAEAKLLPWGYDLASGPFFTVVLIWLETMFALGIYTLVRIYRRSKDLIQRKQIKLFLVATMIPLIGGTITDGIMPILRITVFPTATLLISVMSIMIVYGIRRYGLFKVSPATYSGTILETMGEAVLGVDAALNIRYANPGAQNLLGLGVHELSGSSLASIFSNTVFRDIAGRMREESKESDTVAVGETQVVNPGRGLVWVSLSSTRVRSADGRTAGYVLVMANITEQKRLLASLQSERDRVGAIIGSMSESMVAIDENNHITLMNQSAEEMLGVSAKEYIGRPFYEAVEIFENGKKLERDQLLLSRTIREGRAIAVRLNDNFTLKNKAGKEFPFEATTAPINMGGHTHGAMIIFHDITAEKHAAQVIERKVIEQTHRLREEQTRFEASIQSLQLGFIMTDTEGQILTVNQAAGNLLGPAHLTEGLKGIDKALSVELSKEMKKTVSTRKARSLKEIRLGSKYLRIFITPIVMSNDAIGCVILFEDVTDEKVLQRSKDEFFSIASHELRTPLAAIRGNTAMIQSYFGDEMKSDDFKNMIKDIHESSVRLIELVNDFLDASRLEQGKMVMELSAFDLQEVVGEVAKEIGVVAKEKGLAVEPKAAKDLPQVYADRDKIKQILYNLVGNSVKFANKGKIVVTSSVTGNRMRVEVSDTGKGIPPEKQIYLFHKFQQAGESLLTRDATRGTGLGLYISRLLIEKMGGEINLASSDDKGTTFYFTVPLAESKVAV